MIAIIGATGNLGRLVIKQLTEIVPPNEIVAIARNLEKAEGLRQMGVDVREGDYDRPETLPAALKGVDKVLLISAPVAGERVRQHKAVIDAARVAGVKLIAYTSMLRADTTKVAFASEHKATEEVLTNSGVDYVLLRNGWWFENDTDPLATALANGAVIGCAGNGRFAGASRADYAAAAAVVLTGEGHIGKIYELAGDHDYSLPEFVEEVSKQVGRTIEYRNLPTTEFKALLLSFGLPESMVDTAVEGYGKSESGTFASTSKDLHNLIGRPTTPLKQAVAKALDSMKS